MIYVIGCNHGIQQQKAGDSVVRAQQRSCFAELIDNMVTQHEIQLICEEWDHNGGATIAHDIAQKQRVRWVNINTTRENLESMRIQPFYTKGPCSPERKAEWHAKREQFMLRKIDESRMGAKELLIACGFDHMLHLSDLLRQITLQVEPIDYRERDWYKGDVFSGS